MSIFPNETEQHEYAQITLNRYVDEGWDKRTDWEVRGTIRKDVMARAQAGITVKKVIIIRRLHPQLEITTRQVYDMLSALNAYDTYSPMSFDILDAIEKLDGVREKNGFNSADVAIMAFGPSDKDYERGKKQQSVKKKLRRMCQAKLLKMHKYKHYKLPVWGLFYAEVRIIKSNVATQIVQTVPFIGDSKEE